MNRTAAALHGGNGADNAPESEKRAGPLPPFRIDALARKIAVKAFVGDLLMEWKRQPGATLADHDTAGL